MRVSQRDGMGSFTAVRRESRIFIGEHIRMLFNYILGKGGIMHSKVSIGPF